MTINKLWSNGWWILGCSYAVSSFIFKCVKCRQYRRSTDGRFTFRQDRTRLHLLLMLGWIVLYQYLKYRRKELKKYGLILTCLCSRAIHIEMVDDLSTDAFMNALRAFIAIRVNVWQLRCDKGSNFVGTQREFATLMKDMYQEKIKAFGCEFLINPPRGKSYGRGVGKTDKDNKECSLGYP